ncbi:MAG: hypothetical protein RBR71_11050 [Gudongella sp.]|nr:hypothetical protein [Gudongella sp.]
MKIPNTIEPVALRYNTEKKTYEVALKENSSEKLEVTIEKLWDFLE